MLNYANIAADCGISAPRFYFFDVGIANYLLKRGMIQFGSEAFGRAFEHFIYQEIHAHSSYSDLNYPIHYWRTASGIEVDFILGDHEIALEVKATPMAHTTHLFGLKRFAEEYQVKHKILVTNDEHPRTLDGIMIFPWKVFPEKLWPGELIS